MPIFVIGEVSSGKSSLINGLVGGNISNSSLQRETFYPEGYVLSSTGTQETFSQFSNDLESQHKKNEQLRNNINDIKEENISTIKWRNNGSNKLLSKLVDKDFRIIDFPGINDSEDENDMFFKAIKNNIHLCDLLIYVTDSSSAFTKKSEIDYFNKIKKLVDEQLNDGNFMQLIIVANKFDNKKDPDLNDIYKRISDKIKDVKSFRVSSHKLLIHQLIKEKKTLYIPKFLVPELSKIFSNANINITKKLKKSIKSNVLDYNLIKYNQTISSLDGDSDSESDSDWDSDNNNNSSDITGDWDGLTIYIKKFYNSLKVNSKDNLDKLFDKYFKETFNKDRVVDIASSTGWIACIDKIFNLPRLRKLFIKMNSLNITLYRACFPKKLLAIGIYNINVRYYSNKYLVSTSYFHLMILNYIRNNSDLYCNYILKSISMLFESNSTPLPVLLILLSHPLTERYITYLCNTEGIYLKVLNNDLIWRTNLNYNCDLHIRMYSPSPDTLIYNSINGEKVVIKTDCKEYGDYNGLNFICNHVNKDLQRIIKLSMTPIKFLKILDKENKLPYCLVKDKLCDKNEDKFKFVIRYCENSNQSIIGQALFTNKYSDSSENNYEEYVKIRNYFNNIQ